jgi:hypothetical protein
VEFTALEKFQEKSPVIPVYPRSDDHHAVQGGWDELKGHTILVEMIFSEPGKTPDPASRMILFDSSFSLPKAEKASAIILPVEAEIPAPGQAGPESVPLLEILLQKRDAQPASDLPAYRENHIRPFMRAERQGGRKTIHAKRQRLAGGFLQTHAVADLTSSAPFRLVLKAPCGSNPFLRILITRDERNAPLSRQIPHLGQPLPSLGPRLDVGIIKKRKNLEPRFQVLKRVRQAGPAAGVEQQSFPHRVRRIHDRRTM